MKQFGKRKYSYRVISLSTSAIIFKAPRLLISCPFICLYHDCKHNVNYFPKIVSVWMSHSSECLKAIPNTILSITFLFPKTSFGSISRKFCACSYTGICFLAKNLYTKRACGWSTALIQYPLGRPKTL
jgi:hypothetical protein